MKKRISTLISTLGLKQAAFCRECGIQDSTISTMGDYLNTQNVIKIARRFPDLNLRWLLLGEGEIWLPGENERPKGEDTPPFSYTPQESPEIPFLRDMVCKQHDTIQILIRHIEKNYNAREDENQ